MAVTSVTDAQPTAASRGRLFLGVALLVGLVVVLGTAVVVGGALAFDRFYQGRVFPGVSVAGVDVSGLTETQLRDRLAGIDVLPAEVEIAIGRGRVTVPVDALGGRVDVDGAVVAALAVGRHSGAIADTPDRIAAWRDGRDIPLHPTVDDRVLRAWVLDLATKHLVAPRNALIVAAPEGWRVFPALRGRSLDVSASLDIIESAILGGASPSRTVELPIDRIEPGIDDIDAALAIAGAERMSQPVTLTIKGGKKTWSVPAATIRSAITFVGDGQRLTPVVDQRLIAAAVAPINKDVARPAKQTLFLKTKGGSVFGFVPGSGGRSLDVAATSNQVIALVAGRLDGSLLGTPSMRLVTTGLPPKLSPEEAAKVAPQMTLVGAWTTRFVPSERNANGANIRLPAAFINGTVVRPGAVFDFWQAVGPVTFGRGFGMGGIIQGGRTNPTGAIGGGICSASTTLFNAAARGGFQILERDNHAYYITRYPLGLDATVSKMRGGSTQNMRFRNDTNTPIFIRGYSGGGWVRFEIYSLPNGRTVTFSRPSVSNVRPAIDTVVRTAALRKGQTYRQETPADGKDVVVTRTVRDASGRIIHSDRWVSHYIRVDGILRVGIG